MSVTPPAEARIAAPFQATAKQLEVARHWHDPVCRIVLIGGAIRSGKTQAAGRLLVETAVEQRSTYLVARLTYRELEDSTKQALLYGDGSVPALIPAELVNQYRASDNLVRLKTGSERSDAGREATARQERVAAERERLAAQEQLEQADAVDPIYLPKSRGPTRAWAEGPSRPTRRSNQGTVRVKRPA